MRVEAARERAKAIIEYIKERGCPAAFMMGWLVWDYTHIEQREIRIAAQLPRLDVEGCKIIERLKDINSGFLARVLKGKEFPHARVTEMTFSTGAYDQRGETVKIFIHWCMATEIGWVQFDHNTPPTYKSKCLMRAPKHSVTEWHILDPEGNAISTPTEEDVFRVLRLKYVPPNQRMPKVKVRYQ